MKPVRYLLISVILVSLNSCMVRDTRYAARRHQHSLSDNIFIVNGYNSSHPRPPIN
ncbi:MAG: hypothetical protein ACHQIM_06760 [Sphingobacteriales bacterium]